MKWIYVMSNEPYNIVEVFMKKLLVVFISALIMVAALFSITVLSDDVSKISLVPGNAVAGNCLFTVNVTAHIPDGVELSHIGFFVNVPEELKVDNFQTCCIEGVFSTPELEDPSTFKIIWDADSSSFPTNDDILLGTFTFASDTPFVIGATYEIGIEVDPDNMPVNMAGEPVSFSFDSCTVVISKRDTHVGDPNGDAKINLTDASIVMKHIAKWGAHTCNPVQADVNTDCKINLADVSLLMKNIAKWTTARIGHNDSVTVVKAPTCKEAGKSTLTCRNCGDSITVDTNAVSCSYKKTTVTAPTCNKEGTDKYTCSMCGDSYTKTVKATGKHNYLKGICCDCGYNSGTSKVYTVGQKWTVAGQWEFTVDSVTVHRFCNNQAPSDDSYFGGEEVVFVNYTYKNLGYQKNGLGLYICATHFETLDQNLDFASNYPCTHEKIPKRIEVGKNHTASEAFVLKEDSSHIVLNVSIYRSDKSVKENATFVLKIS